MFGWDFDTLALAIQLQLFKAMDAVGRTEAAMSLSTMVETLGEGALKNEVTADWDLGMFGHGHPGMTCIECWIRDLIHRCLAIFERNGDTALQSDNAQEAIIQYSTALYLNPPNPAGLLVKRSKARVTLGLWEDALKDADEVLF